jgi:hypothetical protein
MKMDTDMDTAVGINTDHFQYYQLVGAAASLAPDKRCYRFAAPSSKVVRGAMYFILEAPFV